MFTLLKGFEKSIEFNKNILFIHIPKCGGTTVDRIITEYIQSSNHSEYSFYRFKEDFNNLTKFIKENNSDLYFVSGHNQENLLDIFKHDLFKFAIVRDPISMFISHYKFHIFRNKIDIKKFNIENFMEFQKKLFNDNLIVRFFSNNLNNKKKLNSSDLDNAIINAKNIDLLVDYSNWNLALNIIISLMNLPNILYSNYQSIKYDFNYNVSKLDKNLIKSFCLLDIEFYNQVFEKNKIYFKDEYSINFNKIRNKNNFIFCSPFIESLDKQKKVFSREDFEKLINKLKISYKEF